MSHSRRSYTDRRRLHTTAKVVALIAALGFVTLMLEQPRWSAPLSRSSTTIEQSLQAADRGAALIPRSTSDESQAPAPASERLPLYFPGQFSLPDGEIELQPAGF